MPLQEIKIGPGVNTQLTATKLHETQWSQSQLIRFKDKLPQKLGGWQRMTSTPLVGVGRGMHGWADLSGNPYIAVGTDQRLEVLIGGELFDITPLRATHNVAVSFSTIINTKTVTINDTAHGAAVGDWVNVVVPVSVGGLIIQGFYQIQTVPNANSYTITAASNATATVTNGGAVPSFNTSGIGVTVVTVTLANHGLTNGNFFTVQVATTVGGIVIATGSYPVSSVTTNTFQITPGGVSSGAATVSENGGNAQLQYLIPTGPSSAQFATGYGIGPYGSGPYGIGTGGSGFVIPLREWFLDHWGQDLIGNYTNGPSYYWQPPLVAPATLVPNGPLFMTASFVAMPEQIFVALGAETGGVQDPNLIRWTDVADFTDWTASATNQAGSFRLPNGSRIVGGIQGGQFAMISTDVDVWLMQYIGFPLVFGFNKLASNVDWLSARCCGIYKGAFYWVASNNFYYFDGNTVGVLPCTVWDFFFNNLNRMQREKVFCWSNSWFSEIWWFFPSTSGNGEVDSYVKYTVDQNIWDYGMLGRTCGIDDNVLGAPIATESATNLIQQHEIGYDADGQPMQGFIQSGYFSISDGTFFTHIDRLIMDAIFSGPTNSGIYVTIYVQNYPTDPVQSYGPYAWRGPGNGPPYSVIRARGRVAAVKIATTDLSVFWRYGALRLNTQPAGRR